MTHQVFELSSNTERGNDPELYYGDPEVYKDLIAKGTNALRLAGADAITFYYVESTPESGFLEEQEFGDKEVTTTEIDGVEYFIPQEDDYYDTTWLGPDLKVTKYRTTLVWRGKYDDEELWCDL